MCLIEKGLVGGPGEVRTPDPMVANHVLSQLSYRPTRTLSLIVTGICVIVNPSWALPSPGASEGFAPLGKDRMHSWERVAEKPC